MGIKDVMKKLGKTSSVLEDASSSSTGFFFSKINRDNAENLAELATGIRMEKPAIVAGTIGIAAYTAGSALYGPRRDFQKGEIVGGTVANTMNTMNTGVTSPYLNADLNTAMKNPEFMDAYSSENFNISNRHVGADMVFAMHHLR